MKFVLYCICGAPKVSVWSKVIRELWRVIKYDSWGKQLLLSLFNCGLITSGTKSPPQSSSWVRSALNQCINFRVRSKLGKKKWHGLVRTSNTLPVCNTA